MSEHITDSEQLDIIDKRVAQGIHKIEGELAEIKESLAFIKDTMIRADTTIAKVAEQVMPTLDELMKSPMLRMLTGGKKK